MCKRGVPGGGGAGASRFLVLQRERELVSVRLTRAVSWWNLERSLGMGR
jgi:hypothetical protein